MSDVANRNPRMCIAQEFKEPAVAAREFLAGNDARTLAEDLRAMEQADFSAAFGLCR